KTYALMALLLLNFVRSIAQLTSLIFTKAFPLITLLAKGLSNGMRWLRRAKPSQYYQVIS
ncbi:hypothetical protein, partial [uncultured Nostoc sp.]